MRDNAFSYTKVAASIQIYYMECCGLYRVAIYYLVEIIIIIY